MRDSRRRLRLAVMSALAVIAICGYLIGHGHGSSAAPVEKVRGTLTTANVVLTYPSGWQRDASVPPIPGLSIEHPVGIAPHGDGGQAGLVIGQLPGGESSPLPASFVASLRGLPTTEVVELSETQSFRYSKLSVPAFERELTLYALPSPGGATTVLACYASPSLIATAGACEQIVATLSLAGQQPSYALIPEPTYAHKLDAAIAELEQRRVAVRRDLRQSLAPVAIQRLANRAASGFATAAESLAALEPSPVVGTAQASLLRSLTQAHDAYAALGAANATDAGSFGAARSKVTEAEAQVDAGLESYVLLGYKPI